jgi:hypothetical protein
MSRTEVVTGLCPRLVIRGAGMMRPRPLPCNAVPATAVYAISKSTLLHTKVAIAYTPPLAIIFRGLY